jgi:hypothetical protein
VGCAEVSWSGVRGKRKSRVGCAEVSWSGVRMELGESARVEAKKRVGPKLERKKNKS